MDDEFGKDTGAFDGMRLYPEGGEDFAWILPEEVAKMLGCDIAALQARVVAGNLVAPEQIGDTCQMGWLSLMH